MAQRSAGPRAGMNVVLHHRNPVDKDISKTGRVMMRIAIGSVVLHLLRIEHYQIGPLTFPNLPPLLQPKSGRWERSHSADGLLERKQLELAHVVGQHSGVVA